MQLWTFNFHGETMPELYSFLGVLIITWLILFFVIFAPLNNWNEFGVELLLHEKWMQKIYPKFFLKRIYQNILSGPRRFYSDLILDLILYARKMKWTEEEKIGWQIFEQSSMGGQEIFSALGEVKYLPLHQELLQHLTKVIFPQQVYYELMCRNPKHYPELPQMEYRNWAWSQLKHNPEQNFIAYVAERFPKYRDEAWSLLMNMSDNRWAMYYLVNESDELRLPAWAVLKPQLENALIRAKSMCENDTPFFAPNTQVAWSALRDSIDIKKSLLQLWKFDEISDEAWHLATCY